MARKTKGRGRVAKRAGRATRPRPAKRNASGSYTYKGKSIPFSRLPKAEKARLRSLWAVKATKARKAVKVVRAGKQIRDWVKRRTEWVPKHGQPQQYAGMLGSDEILSKLSAKQIDKARAVQKRAHSAWVSQGRHAGGDAFAIVSETVDSLGKELAAVMPQMWWYH